MCIHLHGRMSSSNTVSGDVPDGLIPNNIDQMNERQLFAHTDGRYVICRYVIKVEMFHCLCGVLLEAGLAIQQPCH